MTAALSIGRWTHKAPLGYLNGDTKAHQPSLLLDPERAPLMRRAFELAAEHPLVRTYWRRLRGLVFARARGER